MPGGQIPTTKIRNTKDLLCYYSCWPSDAWRNTGLRREIRKRVIYTKDQDTVQLNAKFTNQAGVFGT